MGGQISSSSPGTSSLGSAGNGHRSGSASERSLTTSSSIGSSSRHSQLASLSGGRLPSSPPPAVAMVDLIVSPPALFRQHPAIVGKQQKHHLLSGKEANGGSNALSRWGSFTRALPTLVRAGTGGHPSAADDKSSSLLLRRGNQQQQQNGRPRPGHRFAVTDGLCSDANNNNSHEFSIGFHQQNTHPPFYESDSRRTSSFRKIQHNHQQSDQRLWTDKKDEEHMEEEEMGQEEEYGDEEEGQKERGGRREFSLKQSLKKSGSRIFNGIVRLRAFLNDNDDEEEEEEGREESEEDDEKGEQENEGEGLIKQLVRHKDLLNNNNNNEKIVPDSRQSFPPTKSSGRRPSTVHQQQHNNSSSKGVQLQRNWHANGRQQNSSHQHQHLPSQRQQGQGMLSSMLLAMAASGQHQQQQQQSAAEELTSNNNKSINNTSSRRSGKANGGREEALLDWNGNSAGTAASRTRHSAASGTTALADGLLHGAQPQLGQRRKVIQASSSELMRALGQFVCQHCQPSLGARFEPSQLSTWLRGVDRALILQGWQDIAFINPANLVFLFMLIRDAFAQGECLRLRSLDELHSFVLLCLYISYSYMGNEISYPLKPFITEHTNRTLFWSQCVRLIKNHSAQMLRLNSSSAFFLEVFSELKTYSTDPEFASFR